MAAATAVSGREKNPRRSVPGGVFPPGCGRAAGSGPSSVHAPSTRAAAGSPFAKALRAFPLTQIDEYIAHLPGALVLRSSTLFPAPAECFLVAAGYFLHPREREIFSRTVPEVFRD